MAGSNCLYPRGKHFEAAKSIYLKYGYNPFYAVDIVRAGILKNACAIHPLRVRGFIKHATVTNYNPGRARPWVINNSLDRKYWRLDE